LKQRVQYSSSESVPGFSKIEKAGTTLYDRFIDFILVVQPAFHAKRPPDVIGAAFLLFPGE
jgi:hypothetical protein